MRETKPVWTSSSFLLYTGGLTVLGGGLAALGYLSSRYGSGAKAAWALLVLAILYWIAHALRLRGRQIAAGIFAFASVIAWGTFIAFLFEWWGWNGVSGSLSNWSWSRLALWLLILAAAWDDRRRFGFPFIRLISAVVGWLFVVDLITHNDAMAFEPAMHCAAPSGSYVREGDVELSNACASRVMLVMQLSRLEAPPGQQASRASHIALAYAVTKSCCATTFCVPVPASLPCPLHAADASMTMQRRPTRVGVIGKRTRCTDTSSTPRRSRKMRRRARRPGR